MHRPTHVLRIRIITFATAAVVVARCSFFLCLLASREAHPACCLRCLLGSTVACVWPSNLLLLTGRTSAAFVGSARRSRIHNLGVNSGGIFVQTTSFITSDNNNNFNDDDDDGPTAAVTTLYCEDNIHHHMKQMVYRKPLWEHPSPPLTPQGRFFEARYPHSNNISNIVTERSWQDYSKGALFSAATAVVAVEIWYREYKIDFQRRCCCCCCGDVISGIQNRSWGGWRGRFQRDLR